MLTTRELERRTFAGHLAILDNWKCPQQTVVPVLVLVLAFFEYEYRCAEYEYRCAEYEYRWRSRTRTQ
jgi:hypothetical protein